MKIIHFKKVYLFSKNYNLNGVFTVLLQYLLPIVFFSAIIIQLFFIVGFFTRLSSHQDKQPIADDKEKPSVSVIVAAWNELENLKELLPILENQQYPNFEIIVVDDRSIDGTYDYLLFNEGHYKKTVFVRVESIPNHFTAKKYAVTMGIKKATKEIVLLTDADCRPASEDWIDKMVAQLAGSKDIVLGFSPYQIHKGSLNALIRYETFYTAIQYLSFALAKIPYMGVGRNLMYRRELFWLNNGFANHLSLLGGDDDLFINAAANNRNTAICTSAETHTISEPKMTWKEWMVQKRRHLSVGKKYKFRDKCLLGLLAGSQIAAWLFFLPAFFLNPNWFKTPEWSRIPTDLLDKYRLQDFYLYTDWMRLITFIFVAWLLIRWIVLAKANNKLNKTISNRKILKYDFLYTIYMLILGVITIFSDPKKIKWR